jgi:hypothetical protein
VPIAVIPYEKTSLAFVAAMGSQLTGAINHDRPAMVWRASFQSSTMLDACPGNRTSYFERRPTAEGLKVSVRPADAAGFRPQPARRARHR